VRAPADIKRFLRRQLAPSREKWQRPRALIRALELRKGNVVAEIGAGPGYFTPRLARAVGRDGRIYAVDPEPRILDVLRKRLDGVPNVTPVLNSDADPMLPPGSCDLALIVNAYHHFDDAPDFLRRVVRCLTPRGRLVNVDWVMRDTPMGPPLDHRVAPDEFLRAARRAGLALVAEHDFLPYQYFLILRRTRTR
jgi:ubiquinone/menaquinone biosynthesis C-methylase UbiE